MGPERRVHVEERGRGDAVALAEAHGVSLQGLELDPLAVGQVVVERRVGVRAHRVEDRHARVGVAGGEPGALRGGEGDHLVDDPAVHRAGLGDRAEHARRDSA